MNKPINFRPPVSTALPLRSHCVAVLAGRRSLRSPAPLHRPDAGRHFLSDTHSACREGEAEALIQPPRHHLFPLPALSFSLSLSFPPRASLSLQGCFPLAAPPASQPAEDYFQIRRRSAYSLGALRGVGCGAILRTISIFHLEKAAMKRPWKKTHYFHIPQRIQMMIGGIVNFLSGFLNGAKKTSRDAYRVCQIKPGWAGLGSAQRATKLRGSPRHPSAQARLGSARRS